MRLDPHLHAVVLDGAWYEQSARCIRGSGGELLARTFAVDVLTCPNRQARMRLLAVIKEPASIARTLAAVGETTEGSA